MTAPIDYAAVLADLEAKRGQIDAAIAVIRALIGTGATNGAGEIGSSGDSGAEAGTPLPLAASRAQPATNGIASDAFFKLSTSAAIKKYLSMVKRPQTAKAIADALHAGGQIHAADQKTAYTNVATALRRGLDKDFVQTRNKDWGLAEWYGNKPKGDE